MDKSEIGTHMSHCYQGENEHGCKYADWNCPAKVNYIETFELILTAEEIQHLIWGIENEIGENEFYGEARRIRDCILNKLKVIKEAS